MDRESCETSGRQCQCGEAVGEPFSRFSPWQRLTVCPDCNQEITRDDLGDALVDRAIVSLTSGRTSPPSS